MFRLLDNRVKFCTFVSKTANNTKIDFYCRIRISLKYNADTYFKEHFYATFKIIVGIKQQF